MYSNWPSFGVRHRPADFMALAAGRPRALAKQGGQSDATFQKRKSHPIAVGGSGTSGSREHSRVSLSPARFWPCRFQEAGKPLFPGQRVSVPWSRRAMRAERDRGRSRPASKLSFFSLCGGLTYNQAMLPVLVRQLTSLRLERSWLARPRCFRADFLVGARSVSDRGS